jgi:Fic family protein
MYHHVMALFATPPPDEAELEVISMIDDLRLRMRHRIDETPRRWSGGLRRMLEASAIQGSNTIEGYDASLDDVLAVMDGEAPFDAGTETRLALQGYQEAMTYALQASQDDAPFLDEGLLKAWHFMMLKHDLSKLPGRWRPGPVYVYDEERQERVYEGPPSDDVPRFIHELVESLDDDFIGRQSDAPHVIVRAAMAHLNLVMIHPFKDGNGRMARCLQTYVLAREKIMAPVFSSIEEYLGSKTNTVAYYNVLAEVGQGAWHPERDARSWVRFCLRAHFRQARTVLRRIERAERLWIALSELAETRGLPERCIGPLSEAALGRRIRRANYIANVEVTYGETVPNLTASRDLKTLVTAGLFQPIGDTRGRHYLATPTLRDEWEKIRAASEPSGADEDPFSLVQLRLDISA